MPQSQSITLHNYKFDNISISGLAGTGSTTLLNLLKDYLKFDGWSGFSGGEFMRAYSLEKGLIKYNRHHDASVYGADFDRQIDYGMRDKFQKEKKWIIEAWLSGFMAQKISRTLKVLVICSNNSVRIDRIVNRDQISVHQAKINILKRAEINMKKWSQMYAKEWQEWVVDGGKADKNQPINFWQENLYDLVIDTYVFNKQQTFKKVIEYLNVEVVKS